MSLDDQPKHAAHTLLITIFPYFVINNNPLSLTHSKKAFQTPVLFPELSSTPDALSTLQKVFTIQFAYSGKYNLNSTLKHVGMETEALLIESDQQCNT